MSAWSVPVAERYSQYGPTATCIMLSINSYDKILLDWGSTQLITFNSYKKVRGDVKVHWLQPSYSAAIHSFDELEFGGISFGFQIV